MKRYPFWSYFSITAIDAPLISLSWYLYFVQKSEFPLINWRYCLILVSSVWMGYMADRLFDIQFKEKAQFTTLRHQFCKQYQSSLWNIWINLFLLTLVFSIYSLNSEKIVVGLLFVLIILIYNCLNQYFSKSKFPKELCVAILFACGTFFFITAPINKHDFMFFSLICFLNCIMLTHKDRTLDKLMGVNSLTHPYSHRFIFWLILLSATCCFIAFQGQMSPFLAICLINMGIHCISKRFDEEQFRAIIESTYIVIPLFTIMT